MNKFNENKWFILTAVIALLVAGAMDKEDQKAQEKHYCEMVESGAWGAYNDDIKCEVKE